MKRLTLQERRERDAENKIKAKAYFREYYEKNKEKIAEKHREWAKNNREKMRECSRKFQRYKTSAEARKKSRDRYRKLVGEENLKKDLCIEWKKRLTRNRQK